jgi:outer membrane protein
MTGTESNQGKNSSIHNRISIRFQNCQRIFFLLWVALAVSSLNLKGQNQLETPEKIGAISLTLDRAVESALSRYPSIRAALAHASAASAGIGLARTAYLPRTDLVWQDNRATRNNVFGLFFPQSIPLPISGPVLGTNTGTSVWGSATGFLFTWEPFDFGLRNSRVGTARAQENQATARVAVTRLDVAIAAADAFLGVVAAQQTVRVAQANVERARVLADTTEVLVKNELRPGADASRARAELALAQTQLIQAQQGEQISRVTLSQLIGMAGAAVTIVEGPLLQLSPSGMMPPISLTNHPVALAQSAAVDVVRARERELDRSYFPRFEFQSASFGRGTGAQTNGQVLRGLNGLSPNIINWAVGFTAKFPLFDFASIRSRKAIERFNESAESARLDQVILDLTGQYERAKADAEGARRIAENTPVQLEAARVTEQQVRSRYQAGLATLVEVADAQRLLTQAEIEDSLARLRVWRALLSMAASQGDLEPILRQVRSK